MEIWKDVKGYEGKYQVSNLGRIKSLNYHRENIEKIMTPRTDKDGYIIISLCLRGVNKTKKVHRIVAEAFISNPNNLPQVNHIDEDKTNNNANNLEWCTSKYNTEYSQAKQVIGIKLDGTSIVKFKSIVEASKFVGVSKQCISECCNKRRWVKSAGGYKWYFYKEVEQ